GGIAVGQMVLDTYVGPATSDAATWGSRGNTTIGAALSASEKYLQESSKVARVAKVGGKIIPVVGFLFDANEVAVGYRNVDALEEQIEDVKEAQAELIDKIRLNRATFTGLVVKIGRLRRDVENSGRGWTAQTREALEEEMRRTGYRPRI